jgi:hypothetical protein
MRRAAIDAMVIGAERQDVNWQGERHATSPLQGDSL